MRTLANSLLRLQSDRRGDVKLSLTADERLSMIKRLYENLLQDSGLSNADLATGYLVLRFCREHSRITDARAVNDVIKSFELRAVMPPIIVTHHAMAALATKQNILDLERETLDNSIIFSPEVRAHESTKIHDFTTALEMSEQLSVIRCENEMTQNDISTFLERSVHELDDPNEMNDIMKNVNKTVTDVRELVKQMNLQKEKIQEGEENILGAIQGQFDQIQELNPCRRRNMSSFRKMKKFAS